MVNESLIEEARLHGASVKLSVLKTNPAKRLYGRLVFDVVMEKNKLMRWRSLPQQVHKWLSTAP